MRIAKFIPLSLLAFSASFAANAYINQIGYRVSDDKEFALVDGVGGTVDFYNQAGMKVLSVEPGAASYWGPSGENVQLVNFTALAEPGTYTVKQGNAVLRSDLKISNAPFEEVMKASLKWYYYQRSSMALEETYAGQWKRAAGHPDNNVLFHSSTGASGSTSSPKGWYDAGDYGKYIVNSGISTYTLLALFEHFPKFFGAEKWNIPADGTLPDLLAEIKYNLDWMLTMQATDGAVYHKLTTLEFPGDDMPYKDTAPRYIIGKGTAATFDFAAVMAAASRVYKNYDTTFAAQCLDAAKKAYAWGKQNPNIPFSNPSDVKTGEYGDTSLGDEMFFAGTELAVTTGDASYSQSGTTYGVPNWGDVSGLAVYELAIHGDASAKQTILDLADKFVSRTQSGFGVVMASDDFVWGSNAVAANQGVWLLHAYYLTGEDKYYNAALRVLDYLLGKNPLDISFVTGFGTKSPLHPHHRPSTADKVTPPVPGMLVGGPQPGGEDIGSETWECSDYRTGVPATSYVDDKCSYASNEVAINWNAPFAYLAGAIVALNNGDAPSFAPTVVRSKGTALPTVKRPVANNGAVRLRFADQKLFIEKNGKKFDLNGVRFK